MISADPPKQAVEGAQAEQSTKSAKLFFPKQLRTIGLIFATIAVACVCLAIPRAPVTTDRESSWGAVLVYAHEKGLQFGPQLAFTYGPLGFLTVPFFARHAASARLATDCILSLIIAAGVCGLAWRMALLWRLVFLLLFVFFAANLEFKLDFLFDASLICWTFLCFGTSGRVLFASLAGFIVLAVFAGLGKFTFFCNGLLCVFAISGNLTLRGKWRLGAAVLLSFVALFVFGWMALGQRLSNVPAYMANSLLIAKGYNAMAVEGPLAGRSFEVILALAAFAVVVIRSLNAFVKGDEELWWRRALLLIFLSLILFTAWKHAFVRADRFHAPTFLALVPVLTFASGILPCGTRRAGAVAQGLTIVCGIISFTALQSFCFRETVPSSLYQPASLLASNVNTVIHPAAHLRQMEQALQGEAAQAQLPKLRQIIGPSSVDVFGSYNSYALFNQLNYTPRPMFQSAGGYNFGLNRLNEQFYLSKAAPEYALFRLGPLDHRFPPLEDAMALRCLLTNYEFVDAEGEFLLLKYHSATPAQLTLLREGTVQAGERISLDGFGSADLWMEIRLQPTLRGRATEFFYHLSGVRLKVWADSNETKPLSFRAPAEMLRAGFLASPLIITNQNVLDIYRHQPTRPVAYSVEISRDSASLWNPQAQFRIFKVEKPLAASVAANANFSRR